VNRLWTVLFLLGCHRETAPTREAAPIASVAVVEAAAPDAAPIEVVAVSDAELASFMLARLDAGSSPRVERHDALGSRIAVFTTVAIEPGYYTSCRGFQAIVRRDASGLVLEAIGPATLVDCDNNDTKLRLAALGDTVALLLPVSAGTGEDGDAASDWVVYVPEGKALRKVGRAARWRAAGNGTTTRGGWFGNMEATIVDAGTLTTDETWRFEHYDPVKPTTTGPTKHVMRTYTLSDGGLVRSPAADPTR